MPGLTTAPAPPLTRSGPSSTSELKDNVLWKLLITPITFVSFLLALAFVDARNSFLRTQYHSSGPPKTFLQHLTSTLHSWIYKPQTQPYSYIKSPNGTPGSGIQSDGKGEEQWYWHTKQRKMMRMQVTDAFEIRKTVVVVLVSALICLTGLCVWGTKFVGGLFWMWK